MTQSYQFIGICNPLLDISAVVDMQMLAKYGLKKNDAILAAENQKEIYQDLIDNYKVDYVAGGAGQNVMRGAQWLLPPDSTLYFGCVGDDESAAILKRAAEKDGLRTEYLVSKEHPTGKCGVLITDVDRCLVTDLQAANDYKVDHLKDPRIWSYVQNAGFFYVTGFFLTVSVESALLLAEHCLDANKVFTMNLSAPFVPQFFKESLDKFAGYWDILFGNESEALAYAESQGWTEKSVSEIAARISLLPKKNTKRNRIVVFTQGTDPTIVAQNGKTKEYPIIPVSPEKIVDTNGAGDAFCGGFMSQFVQGASIEKCVACGNYVGSVVVQRSGPTYPSTKPEFHFSE